MCMPTQMEPIGFARGKLLYDESQIAEVEFKRWKKNDIIIFSIPSIFGVIIIFIGLIHFTLLSTIAVAIGLFFEYMGVHGLFIDYKAEPLKVYSKGIKFTTKNYGLFIRTNDDNFEQFSTIKRVFVPDRGNIITLYRKDGTEINYFVLDVKRFVDIAENYIQFEYHTDYKFI